MGELASFLPIILIAVVFYLFLIRPTARRQKEQGRMQSALAVGDKVMLTSGIHAEVVDVDDPTAIVVSIAPGVEITVARGAVGGVLPAVEPATDDLGAPGDPAGEVSLDKRDRPDQV